MSNPTLFKLADGTTLQVIVNRERTALTIRDITFERGLQAIVVRPESSNVVHVRGELL